MTMDMQQLIGNKTKVVMMGEFKEMV